MIHEWPQRHMKVSLDGRGRRRRRTVRERDAQPASRAVHCHSCHTRCAATTKPSGDKDWCGHRRRRWMTAERPEPNTSSSRALRHDARWTRQSTRRKRWLSNGSSTGEHRTKRRTRRSIRSEMNSRGTRDEINNRHRQGVGGQRARKAGRPRL